MWLFASNPIQELSKFLYAKCRKEKMTKQFKIEGMSCNHCVMAVQKNLAKLNLKNFEVTIGSAIVDFDENKITEKKIIESVEEAGYKVVG